MKEAVRDPYLREAEKEGRLARYTLDLGWDEPLAVYILYGGAGGTRKATAYTEALIEVIDEEVAHPPKDPQLLLGTSTLT